VSVSAGKVRSCKGLGLVRLDCAVGAEGRAMTGDAPDAGARESSFLGAAAVVAGSGAAVLATLRQGQVARGCASGSSAPLVPLGAHPFVPLREGPAIRLGTMAASVRVGGSCSEAAPRALDLDDSSGAGCGSGVDVLSVKRKLAPFALARRRGAIAVALESARPGSASRAVGRLSSGFYAKTSDGPRKAQLATVARILRSAGFQCTPLSLKSLEVLAAALKDAGYRSAKNYLFRAKQAHVRAGFEWSVQLEDLMAQCVRSVTRGLGAVHVASAFALGAVGAAKALAVDPSRAVIKGGMIAPFDAVIVASSWMMRGLEAATVLGEQVFIAKDESKATIELGPTKMNPGGRECPRSLVCACTGTFGARARNSLCPVHALVDLLAARAALGLDPKHCLLCSESGHSVSSAVTIASLRLVTGDALATEHSMRRAGAQHYARSGVMLYIIQFLGRWGSAVVERYVGNAFIDVAAAASLGGGGALQHSLASCVSSLSSGGGSSSDVGAVGNNTAEKFEAWWKLASCRLSEQAVVWHKSWMEAQDSACGGVRLASGRGRVHLVTVGDLVFPLVLWSTRCGWLFGSAPHVRVGRDEVSCLRCLGL
jgi:hypothetical protein